VLAGHSGGVTALAVAPDGGWLASAAGDHAVRVWDPAAGHVHAFIRMDSDITQLAWADASALAVAGSAGVCVFDLLGYQEGAIGG
jgi:WD40 repeat protein